MWKYTNMDAVKQSDANRFLTVTNYLYQVQETCYNKCVVDFQSKDIGAMEKKCSQACIAKHMAIYKDLVKE